MQRHIVIVKDDFQKLSKVLGDWKMSLNCYFQHCAKFISSDLKDLKEELIITICHITSKTENRKMNHKVTNYVTTISIPYLRGVSR